MRRKHVHDLRICAQPWYVVSPFGAMAGAVPRTIVLLRCECRPGVYYWDTASLAGHWTLSDLLGDVSGKPPPNEVFGQLVDQL